jgi:hypothetical protein
MWRRLLSVLGCLPHLLIRSVTDCIAKTQVIMAGLDNIDPAVLCLDGVASRAQASSRLTVERVSSFVDKRQHAG